MKQNKILPDERSCSPDTPYEYGFPRVTEVHARLLDMETLKNNAYAERNQLVAALSKLFPASLERHPESEEYDDDWRWIAFIDLPTGQVCWHIHDSELPLFAHLPKNAGRRWDGHDREEKYRRVARLKKEIPMKDLLAKTRAATHKSGLKKSDVTKALKAVRKGRL